MGRCQLLTARIAGVFACAQVLSGCSSSTPTGVDGLDCHPSYPQVCIPPPPPDLDCDEIAFSDFQVVGSDPHGFDTDDDGIGCETAQ